MALYESIVVDGNQIPVSGAKGYVYISGILTTGLTDDLGAPLENPVTTGSGANAGYVKFHIPASAYTIKWFWLGKQRLIETFNAVTSTAEQTPPTVTPEQFGAVGYLTSAEAKAGVDNRAAFQAAIDALTALGGGTIALGKPHYGFAASARTTATGDLTTNGLSGIPLRIAGKHITFKSTCGRTDIWRRAQGMADPATWANWPLLSGGGGWRGGCIFLEGLTSAPADYSGRPGVTLDCVYLQGGITRGSSYGALNTTTGDGWDISDKGIWADNRASRYEGDIRIINGGVIGFRGELVYTSDDPDTTLYIRGGVCGETNAQCINPNSTNLDVDGFYGYNANMPFEGWGGKAGRLVNAVFENCANSGSLQGGKAGAGTFSSFYAPTRVSSTVTPYCHMDNVTFKNAAFRPGSWLDIGKVTLIDCQMIFGNDSFQDGIIDTRISDLVFVTDQTTGAGLAFAGGDGVASANQSIQDIKIDRISFQRTKVARAASRLPGAAVSWYGSLGPGIVIGDLTGEMSPPPVYSAASSGNAVNFLRVNISGMIGWGVASQNVQTTPALQSVANSWRGPVVLLTTTGSSSYPMTLPTSGFVQGSELSLYNSGPGQIYLNGDATSGSGLRYSDGLVYLPLSQTTKFRFDGAFWELDTGGSALTDPNADRIRFWDDSAGGEAWLALGSNLSITGTTLNTTAGAWNLQWSPYDNEAPTTNYATLDQRNSHPVLDFDTTTQETAIFTGALPADYSGAGVTVHIWCSLTSATTGTVGWDVAFERVDASSLDIDADSFGAATTVTAVTVPGTSGQVLKMSVNVSNGANMDGLAAGELFRLRIRRDVANDTAAGDAELLRVMMVSQ